MKTSGKYALLLTALIALIALGSLAAILLSGAKKEQTLTADIYSDGRLYQSIDLNSISKPVQLTLTNAQGGTNIVEIRPGEIAVIEASCPDRLCVRQGFLHDTLLPVTCLPNRLVIQLRPTRDDIDPPDGLAY